MAITAAQVKELRERTGLGMMDCKGALVETDGDIEKAIDLLRKKGMKTAEKRSGRETNQGWQGLALSDDGRSGALVDLACETDFVSKSDEFQALLGKMTAHALAQKPENAEAMLAQTMEGGATVADELQTAVGRIGEKIELRNIACFETDETGALGSYVHFNGSVGVIVKGTVDGEVTDSAALADLLGKIAKHVAGSDPKPIVVAAEDLPADLVERERAIFMGQMKDKPENIRGKIVDGMIRKNLFAKRALLEQSYVFDDKLTVGKAIEQASKDVGGKVVVSGFARFKVGE
jgi:elongation factor Ts